MPRARYPSDEARMKMRPHIKVHLTVATHPKMAELWADLRTRGMLVELWRIAAESFAAKRDDTVTLSPASIISITGMERHSYAVDAVRKLCALAQYPVSCRCAVGALKVRPRCACSALTVKVRNFAKKQGWNSADSGETPAPPPPSYSDSYSDTDSEGREESAMEAPAEPEAARLKLERDSERALRILSDQEGDPDEKRLWLRRNLRACEAWAADQGKSTRAAVLSWWNGYLAKPERPFLAEVTNARRAAHFEAERIRLGIRDGPPPDIDPSPVLRNVHRLGGPK